MPQNSENRVKEFIASGNSDRLDRFLSQREKGQTRSRIHSLINDGWVNLNGKTARPAQRVRAGDRVVLRIPPVSDYDVSPQSIPVNLVYQDSEIVVVDKPAGLSVHPGPGHPDGTLVNALLARCPDIQGIGGVHRPGIVHRLDKDTSGLMVVAKTERAHHGISDQIKERRVHKGYLALTVGAPPQGEGVIDLPIARDPRRRQRMAVVLNGRESRTHYRVMEELGGHALLHLVLETGRTHQIRVHLAHLGYPLYGDPVYGRRSPHLPRHFLHANALGFIHPRSGQKVTFESDLPGELEEVLDLLRLGAGARGEFAGRRRRP